MRKANLSTGKNRGVQSPTFVKLGVGWGAGGKNLRVEEQEALGLQEPTLG